MHYYHLLSRTAGQRDPLFFLVGGQNLSFAARSFNNGLLRRPFAVFSSSAKRIYLSTAMLHPFFVPRPDEVATAHFCFQFVIYSDYFFFVIFWIVSVLLLCF